MPAPWRVSNSVFALFHSWVWFETFRFGAADQFRSTTRSEVALTAIGMVVFGAEIAAALGVLPGLEPSVFLVAVLWFLFLAVSRFVLLANRLLGSSAA